MASCRLEAARAEARVAQAEDEVKALKRAQDRIKMDRCEGKREGGGSCIPTFVPRRGRLEA
jgi:hypothetical protein